MIPIDRLEAVEAHRASPGTLLIGSARYDRDPMFISGPQDGMNLTLRLAPIDQHGFRLDGIVTNLGYWLSAQNPRFLVDHKSKVNLQQSDVSAGNLCLANGKPSIAARLNYGIFYAPIDGSEIIEASYDSLVAFRNWKVVVPGAQDELITIYDHGTTAKS